MDSAIETLDIFDVRGCCLFPKGHHLLSKDLVEIDDLRNEKFITMPPGNAMRNRLQRLFDDYDYQPDIVLETNNLNAIIQAVEKGVGFAIITEQIAADYPQFKSQLIRANVDDEIGKYGFSYNRVSMYKKNEQHFKSFALDFFEELKKAVFDLHMLD